MSAAALPVASHDLPDAAHSLLEAVKALVAFLVAEFCSVSLRAVAVVMK